ncbi:hypothetical protein DTO96_101351 [Ephemeroptericola cinctiostellae]|uniref:Uncharacterized protein n=1 Tax=Ephemeroptericola cinctiostellae TaxID=2268024 RepID=A0A345DB82_9BURK|nr:hypothetical protein [Ephemeroptericola cinctiostellae]AXF85620.1 hypothetical protein DTO96_101351 [Ephemeroptericola cinctiostellae]
MRTNVKHKVVLDTCVVRELLPHSEMPSWVETFILMSKKGYSFSLADGTVLELIKQISTCQIRLEDLPKLFVTLELFLDMAEPVLPGKVDLQGRIGALRKGHNWTLEESLQTGLRYWEMLKNPVLEYNITAPQIIDDEIDSYREMFNKTAAQSLQTDESVLIQAFNVLDRQCPDLIPPLSTRMELQIKYFYNKFKSSSLQQKGYNPLSNKNSNDAVDFDLFRYLSLPAFVITFEKKYLNLSGFIDSIQTRWLMKPNDLCLRWEKNVEPFPIFSSS